MSFVPAASVAGCLARFLHVRKFVGGHEFDVVDGLSVGGASVRRVQIHASAAADSTMKGMKDMKCSKDFITLLLMPALAAVSCVRRVPWA